MSVRDGRRASDRASACSRGARRRFPTPSSSRCCCAPGRPAAARSTSRAICIGRFGGVAGLLAAPAAEVAAVRGVGPAKCRRARGRRRARAALADRGGASARRARLAAGGPRLPAATLAARPYEVFVGLFLDSQNRLLAADELFRGTLAQTSVYPREVVKAALARNAAAMIFAHNHPSGRRRAEPRRRAADAGPEAGAGAGRHPHARPFRRRRRAAHFVRRARPALTLPAAGHADRLSA